MTIRLHLRKILQELDGFLASEVYERLAVGAFGEPEPLLAAFEMGCRDAYVEGSEIVEVLARARIADI